MLQNVCKEMMHLMKTHGNHAKEDGSSILALVGNVCFADNSTSILSFNALNNSENSWILNTGVANRMTLHSTIMLDVHNRSQPLSVKLPNSATILVQMTRSVYITSTLALFDVLYTFFSTQLVVHYQFVISPSVSCYF